MLQRKPCYKGKLEHGKIFALLFFMQVEEKLKYTCFIGKFTIHFFCSFVFSAIPFKMIPMMFVPMVSMENSAEAISVTKEVEMMGRIIMVRMVSMSMCMTEVRVISCLIKKTSLLTEVRRQFFKSKHATH